MPSGELVTVPLPVLFTVRLYFSIVSLTPVPLNGTLSESESYGSKERFALFCPNDTGENLTFTEQVSNGATV